MGARDLTTLDDALLGVTSLGFDTTPFIYFIERHPDHVDIMREIVRRVDSRTLAGVSSVVTLTEVLTRPKQIGNQRLGREYRAMLLRSRSFRLAPVDIPIAEAAADLRARWKLRTPDALQIATALNLGCQAFPTNDRRLRRVTDLHVLAFDDLER